MGFNCHVHSNTTRRFLSRYKTPWRTHLTTQIPTPSQMPIPEQKLFAETYASLLDENAKLRVEIEEVTAQRNAAETWAILNLRQYAVAQHRLNAMSARNDKLKRRIRRKSRVVTSEVGRVEVAAARAEQVAMERKIEETRKKEAGAAAETLTQRIAQGDDVEFKGSLASRNKNALQDLAHALQLSLEGTKAELIKRIVEYLDAHPELKDDNRFAGLFNHHIRGQKRPIPLDDQPENADNLGPPPAHRRRLGDLVNLPITALP